MRKKLLPVPAPRSAREYYAFFGGEEGNIPIEEVGRIWDAATEAERERVRIEMVREITLSIAKLISDAIPKSSPAIKKEPGFNLMGSREKNRKYYEFCAKFWSEVKGKSDARKLQHNCQHDQIALKKTVFDDQKSR